MSQQDENAHEPSPFRPKLPTATLVLPNGERVKRNATFSPAVGVHSSHQAEFDERAPLLGSKSSEGGKTAPALRKVAMKGREKLNDFWAFANSKTGKGVLKCSIAYVLGSCATFVPAIYKALGRQEGKHMVATITVYYHPARSIGSTFEAMLCASAAFIYIAIISFSSMSVSIFFGATLDLMLVGHIIVLIVFCGGGLGFVGWVKQRMSHPLVNISCSLAALAIITVLTKEGAVQAAAFSGKKVTQVLIMVAMGVAISTAVAFAVFPVSARKELHADLVKVNDSFGEMLAVITRAFLTGSEEELRQHPQSETSESYRKAFASMTKNLKDSKYEHYVLGTEKVFLLEAKLVKCLQSLAQNMGGLRSAATTQFLLLSQPTVVAKQAYASNRRIQKRASSYVSFDGTPLAPGSRTPTNHMQQIQEGNVNHSALDLRNGIDLDDDWLESSLQDEDSLPPIHSPSDIFTRFIVQLGPSMKSLAVTMKSILDQLPFDQEGQFTVDNHFSFSLGEAIRVYNKSRQNALEKLYKSKEITQSKSMEMQADFEEVAASCGYFSFSLQEFASEMRTYLEILDELKLESEERPNGRSWNWLKFWNLPFSFRKRTSDPERENLIDTNEETDVPGNIPSPIERRATLSQSETRQSFTEKYRFKIWRALGVFRRDDVKFAIKVGIGAALYALPSYLEATRPFYQHWRGEWGLLSYILVCTMTLGASNTTGLERSYGTILGAVLAIIGWTITGGNPFWLGLYGWIMAYWTAYVVLALGKGPLGRFIVLTYNLSALYAYSYSVQDVDPTEDHQKGIFDPRITEIALHRSGAVLSGCLWGLIVTRLIWPISARRKFKEGLSILWLRMGLIWKRDPINILVGGLSEHTYMDIREEFDLQRFLTRIDNLRGSARTEVHIRGPFPNDTFGRILQSTGAMLDAFHAMNVLILKNPKASKGEEEILKYTASERASLCARISHLFQVLASSMKLEFPMNGALPSVHHTRDRLLAKIFRFRQEEKEIVGATDEDFELLYAYVLVTGQLAEEIKKIGKEIEQLFGILNEDLLKLQ